MDERNTEERNIIEDIAGKEYEHGFVTDLEQEFIPKGLNEDIIRLISAKKEEPRWLLDFRLDAFRKWQGMTPPKWGHLNIPEIDFQDIIYYAAPKKDSDRPKEIDPELEKTFDKLGIPLHERETLAGVAVDAVFDSVSVKTTFRAALQEKGIIFCSFSEAVREHPELVRKYLAAVVPSGDNFYAALNSAVFSDGSFCYIPKGVRCPMELSSYFRINAKGTGQFERTLIVADEGSYVSYMEGCTAPMRDENQLHAAVVEIIVEKDADVKYSTVQNWYPGDAEGRGGIFNFVTKRGICKGSGSHLSWTQVETGSAITWKYPSTILKGDNSSSVLLRRRHEQFPAGGHRNKDDTHRAQHAQPHREQGHLRRAQPEQLPGTRQDASRGGQREELLPVRQPSDRFALRCAHLPRHSELQPDGRCGARGDDLENQRGSALLLQPEGHRAGGCSGIDS